ncbi:hypothetical protein J5839_01835 [Methanosarcinaceae archaeon]|nr:hypothetical protein [Methanosarcinaceae archaeon]
MSNALYFVFVASMVSVKIHDVKTLLFLLIVDENKSEKLTKKLTGVKKDKSNGRKTRRMKIPKICPSCMSSRHTSGVCLRRLSAA